MNASELNDLNSFSVANKTAPKVLEIFKTLLPRLNKKEYADLEESIKEKGQLHLIATCQIDGMDGVFILDGHNRFEILTELNIEPKFEADPRAFKCKEEAMIWVIDNQIIRRNVPQYVRGALALKKKDIMKKIGKALMAENANRTNEKRKEPEWLKKPLGIVEK